MMPLYKNGKSLTKALIDIPNENCHMKMKIHKSLTGIGRVCVDSDG